MATDVSSGMLEQTRRKLRDVPQEVRSRIAVAVFDAAAQDALPGEQYDFVSSNFGVLNCVQHLKPLLENIHGRLAPGGVLALTVMGPFCLWETVGFLWRGNPGKASRRWRGATQYQMGGVSQTVWYHSVSALRRAAAPFFQLAEVSGIGVCVPSTEFMTVCERHPGLFRRCAAIETQIGNWWPFNRFGDHYLAILRPMPQ
jgi:SAM-dependent methyltransferase